MQSLETLRASLPDFAKDSRLNLQGVLDGASVLTSGQRWGVAVASAASARQPSLLAAVIAAARQAAGDDVVDDGLSAASLMAMNNVFYRFRHMVGKTAYAQRPARLRMNGLAQPKTSRTDFELFSLAASAINGCEMCVQAHERVVVEAGLSEDHVLDAVRVASVIHAVAVSLDAAGACENPQPQSQGAHS